MYLQYLQYLRDEDVKRAEDEGLELRVAITPASLRVLGLGARRALRIQVLPIAGDASARRPYLHRIWALSEEVLAMLRDAPDGEARPRALLERIAWEPSDPADWMAQYDLLGGAIDLLDAEGLVIRLHRGDDTFVALTSAGRDLVAADAAAVGAGEQDEQA